MKVSFLIIARVIAVLLLVAIAACCVILPPVVRALCETGDLVGDRASMGEGEVWYVIVMAYPIYGFNAPQIVTEFVKSFPNGTQNVYFLKTSGEPLKLNDASSLTLVKILKKKGYDVRGEYHYVMPYNMIFRHSDALASKMFFTAKNTRSM